jgi:farnesol dehydrogenase
MALGPTGAAAADETQVHPGRAFRNDYERTKARADEIARQAAAAGRDVVLLYPGVVYGPGDRTAGNIVVNMIADHLRGAFPGIIGPGDRLWSYSFVDDVAAGHVEALERGRRGERYLLAGDNVTMNDLFAALAAVTGKEPPRRHIPFAAARALGALLYAWAELTGLPPLLTHEVVGVFRAHWAYDSGKAIRELGYRVTPLPEGLRRTVEWLRSGAAA